MSLQVCKSKIHSFMIRNERSWTTQGMSERPKNSLVEIYFFLLKLSSRSAFSLLIVCFSSNLSLSLEASCSTFLNTVKYEQTTSSPVNKFAFSLQLGEIIQVASRVVDRVFSRRDLEEENIQYLQKDSSEILPKNMESRLCLKRATDFSVLSKNILGQKVHSIT